MPRVNTVLLIIIGIAIAALITGARLDVDDFCVAYHAPGLGLVTFAWTEDLTLDGKTIPLDEYPR
jgi:hypothetical protein